MKDTCSIRKETAFRVEVVVSSYGERHPLIVSRASGLPLFWPSVWLTSSCRPKGLAVGTLANQAQTVAAVYSWAESYGINLDKRFTEGEFLSDWEVGALAQNLRIEVRSQPRGPKVQRLRLSEPIRESPFSSVVTPEVANYRIGTAAKFLSWLADQAACHRLHNAQRSEEARYTEKHRDRMITQMLGHQQLLRSRKVIHLRMAPEPSVITRLLEVVRVDHPENPWADPPMQLEALCRAEKDGAHARVSQLKASLAGRLALRLRNQLIVHLLYHLGLRRGEILGLKARDLKGQVLFVLRHPDDPDDTRRHPPNTKTRDRKLPINFGLQAKFLDYVSFVRSKFARARKHPYLIVNHRDGSPLSMPGLAKIFQDLRGVDGLPPNLTPHHLRHAWNEEFSRLADEQGLDQAREAQIRSELMGWNPGAKNPTAMIYLRRYTKRKAQELSLKMQEEMMHPKDEDA